MEKVTRVGALRRLAGRWRQTHVLVLSGEMRPRGFVEGHDDGHHVLAVEDGRRQNVAGRELCQLVHKRAEVLVLQRPHRTRVTLVRNCPWLLTFFFFFSHIRRCHSDIIILSFLCVY